MAVIKGTTAPTKGNPRPATKPPTAKPLVPAKPLVAAGTGGMGSERNALKRSNPITTPTQMLKPGTRLPLTPNQGSRLINPSVGARPQGGGGLAGLERSMGTGFGLSNNPAAMNALGSADQRVRQMHQALVQAINSRRGNRPPSQDLIPAEGVDIWTETVR